MTIGKITKSTKFSGMDHTCFILLESAPIAASLLNAFFQLIDELNNGVIEKEMVDTIFPEIQDFYGFIGFDYELEEKEGDRFDYRIFAVFETAELAVMAKLSCP